MKKLIILTSFIILLNTGHVFGQTNFNASGEIPEVQEVNAPDFESLMKYVGKYPKQTDFFENPIVTEGLKEILKEDFTTYIDFVSKAGCGEMNYKYGLIYGDVSQLHVSGYASLIFINCKEEKMYLFWLKETVREKNYKIYGDKPVPVNVLNLIVQEMNISWGHVANFSTQADSIKIELK